MIESLKHLWTWLYIFGCGGFCLMALVIIPLGFRDLFRMFRDLKENRDNDAD